jgi:hypothetical protein
MPWTPVLRVVCRASRAANDDIFAHRCTIGRQNVRHRVTEASGARLTPIASWRARLPGG